MIKCQYDASYLESEGSGTDLKVNSKSTPATSLLLYLWCTMYRASLYPGTETTINRKEDVFPGHYSNMVGEHGSFHEPKI